MVCLRVNSAFYEAGVRRVYHAVKMFVEDPLWKPKPKLVLLPLSGVHSAQLARHVRVLEVVPHAQADCVPLSSGRFPPPLPSLRSLRLDLGRHYDRDLLHTDRTGCFKDPTWHPLFHPLDCHVIASLHPRTFILRHTYTEDLTQGYLDDREGTIDSPMLASVHEAIVILDSETEVNYGCGIMITLLSFFKWARPVKFVFVLWTEKRGMEWISETVRDSDREDGCDPTWLQWEDFVPLLIKYPVPEGEPLLTIVNGGAIPKRHGMPGNASTSAIEAQLKAALNAECDARDAAVPGDEKYLEHWDRATRTKGEHVRALSMDEWLAGHNGDAFDEGELDGWL